MLTQFNMDKKDQIRIFKAFLQIATFPFQAQMSMVILRIHQYCFVCYSQVRNIDIK